ncbi:MAG TPA: B-box zinc finger protein [Bryobacteraceae bacterium]
MNCYLHPETPAVAYCRSCGRPLCAACQRPYEATVFCQEHLPAAPYSNAAGSQSSPANPYFQAAAPATGFSPMSTSPVWAFVLGWIPGVGAIYNGQYLKGLVHAVIFGLLITLLNSNSGAEPLFAIIMAVFVFYMPFEAYHTAKKRQQGVAVDEWSSLVAPNPYASRAPVGPVLLILLGVLFLLDTLRIVEFRDLARFWPVLLIVMGAFMLYNRVTTPAPPPLPPRTPASEFGEPRREQ